MFLAFRPYVQRVAWAQWLPKKSATLKVVIRKFVVSFGPITMHHAGGGTWGRIAGNITSEVSFIVVVVVVVVAVRIDSMSTKEKIIKRVYNRRCIYTSSPISIGDMFLLPQVIQNSTIPHLAPNS